MLISKSKYNENQIVTFKLVNGDELVARVVQDNDDEYVISSSTTVVPGREGLGLAASLFTGDPDSKLHIHKSHVMMSSPTVEQMADHYRKLTTGIETVRQEKKIILA